MPYDALVYVIAPPASHPSVEPWLRVYRTAALDPQHIVERPDGIRLTSPPRTALDLTRYLLDKDLRSVIDHVESSGMGTAETMRRVAYDVLSPGRPWVSDSSAYSTSVRKSELPSHTGSRGSLPP
jgi:hypothetical protein